MKCALLTVIVFVAGGEPVALAIDKYVGTAVSTCQYAETVAVGGTCTGVYVGNRIVLTAAHCRSGTTTPTFVTFGDSDTISRKHKTVQVQSCTWHPSGSGSLNSYTGADIMACTLQQDAPNVPIIPPMVPNGCERDWLFSRLASHGSVPATAVGMGCEDNFDPDFGQCTSDHKRYVAPGNPANFRFVGQTGINTLLDFARTVPVVRQGDSGGPAYVRMPDQTYRLIGVVHAFSVNDDQYEAVPSYLHWLETVTGRDLSPCHNRNSSGHWIFHGGCRGLLVKRPDLPGRSWGDPNAMFSMACQPSTAQRPTFLGGGLSQCAGWNPDDILGFGSGLVASQSAAMELEGSLDAMKQSGDLASSCDDETKSLVMDVLEEDSHYLFGNTQRPAKAVSVDDLLERIGCRLDEPGSKK